MENLDPALETPAFPTELAKSFALSAATTVGMLSGLAVYGYVKLKVKERKTAKYLAMNLPAE